MRAPEAGEHWLDRDDLPRGRRADLLPIADIDADMRYPGSGIGVGTREKHQVARLELRARYARRRVVLLLCGARQIDTKLSKHQLDQSGAIQPDGRIAATEE